MDFYDELKALGERSRQKGPSLLTEEATKTALVMPPLLKRLDTMFLTSTRSCLSLSLPEATERISVSTMQS